MVEVGASIAYTGNKLLKDVADLDPELTLVPPFATSSNEMDEEALPKGFGIWNGRSSSKFLLNAGATNPSWLSQMKILYRYNIDILRLQSAVNKALKSFNLIYDHLESSHTKSFYDTAHDMWEAIGLSSLAQLSFNEFLDQIFISSDLPWWRKLLPYQGNLRKELLEAVNLCNYNQNNDNLNGLVGLISFVPTQGELFSILGGNSQLISSAWKQATNTSNQFCSNRSLFQHVTKRVTTVISDTNSFEVWSNDELMGHFDIVILAAPLQQSRISFFIQSHHDGAVLQEMPLNGMIDSDIYDANEHFHVSPPLPISAITKYTQVITTVLSNATVNYSYFHTDKESFPRSVYLTSHGKHLDQFQSMTQITADGVFKLFSSEKLDTTTLNKLFQDGYKVEYVKVWGGPYGGATPNFGGGGEASKSLPYLLYDGGIAKKGRSDGPALYYINSIEATTATMEISAIGAKSVAKLIASRLGLLKVSDDDVFSTEL